MLIRTKKYHLNVISGLFLAAGGMLVLAVPDRTTMPPAARNSPEMALSRCFFVRISMIVLLFCLAGELG